MYDDPPEERTDKKPWWQLRPAEQLARLRRARESHRFEVVPRDDDAPGALVEYEAVELELRRRR